MAVRVLIFVSTVMLACLHFSTGLSIGFNEVDYQGPEDAERVRFIVSKRQGNTEQIVVHVTPLTYSQFEASGFNLPLELNVTDLPDPAEFNELGQRDFDADIQTVTFPPNEDDVDIELYINITDDIIAEVDEGFFIVLSTDVLEDPIGLDVFRSVSLIRIGDNDRVKVSFERQFYSIAENVGDASQDLIQLIIEDQMPSEVSVTTLVTFAQQTAQEGVDYAVTQTRQEFVFPPGTHSLDVPLTIFNDTIPEEKETLQLSISIPPGPFVSAYQIGTFSSAIVDIIDDDIAYIGFEEPEYFVKEGRDEYVDVVIKLLNPEKIDLAASAILTVSQGSAEVEKDYMELPPEAIFVDLPTLDTNELRMTVRVFIIDNDESEVVEDIRLQLLRDDLFTLPNVVLLINETVIFIEDDDAIQEPAETPVCEVCDENAMCVNESGILQCICNPGFTGNGFMCTDINECTLGTDKCDDTVMCYNRDGVMTCIAFADCINTIGSYDCRCRPGFRGNGRKCRDINECAKDLDDCDQNAWCTNLPGSFFCNCKTGFTGDGRECVAVTPIEDVPEEEEEEEEEDEDECTPYTRSKSSRSSTSHSHHTHSTSHGTKSTKQSRSRRRTSHTGTHSHSHSHTTRCGKSTKTSHSRSSTTRTTKSTSHTSKHTTHSTSHSTSTGTSSSTSSNSNSTMSS